MQQKHKRLGCCNHLHNVKEFCIKIEIISGMYRVYSQFLSFSSIKNQLSPSLIANTLHTHHTNTNSTTLSPSIFFIFNHITDSSYYLQARLMDSLSKRPTRRPPRPPSSKITGSWLTPCLFMSVRAVRRFIFGVAVHDTVEL